jgi:hypothetical protein
MSPEDVKKNYKEDDIQRIVKEREVKNSNPYDI